MYSSNEDYRDMDLENRFYYLSEDFEEYQDYEEEDFVDIWNNCCLQSIESVGPLIIKLVFLNSVFGQIVSLIYLPENIFHLFMGGIGVYLVSDSKDISLKGKYILIPYFLISFFILHANHYIKKKYRRATGIFMKSAFVASLILSEHLFVEKEVFLQIRGILMVLVMKVIFLIDEGLKSKEPLGLLQFCGYTLCGANILFGPWITYQDYIQLHSRRRAKGIFWCLGVLRSLIFSLCSLIVSNCLAAYFISDRSNRWLLAYRSALSVRFSHYFVSYMAETGMVAAGFRNSEANGKRWSYTIVDPLKIEFPASLSVVVTKWNRPMHVFLKTSIYQPMKMYGQFIAIMATFLVSSFLHGCEMRVSVVLVSLGVFSYLQVRARHSMSNALNACLNVKPCKLCNHKYKRNHVGVRMLLLVYTFISIIHLAYLGILMDQVSTEDSIYEQWNHLYFVSHIIMGFTSLLI